MPPAQQQATPTPPPPKKQPDGPVVATGCYGEVLWDGTEAKKADRTKGVRRVLLVGGKADDLLARYLRVADEKEVKVKLETLTVFYFVGGGNDPKSLKGGADVTYEVEDVFTRSWEEVWREKLTTVVADRRAQPREDAKRLKADLVCGVTGEKK